MQNKSLEMFRIFILMHSHMSPSSTNLPLNTHRLNSSKTSDFLDSNIFYLFRRIYLDKAIH